MVPFSFFLANSSHLLVTHPSLSTALELLLLETSANSPPTSIKMQFIFQNYLAQFATMPGGVKFRTCRNMFNRILVAQTGVIDTRFREHIGPASIVVGGIMGITAVPSIMGLTAEIAARQARRERVFEETEVRQQLQRSKSMNMNSPPPPSPGLKGPGIRATSSASFDSRRPGSSGPSSLVSLMQPTSSVTNFSNKHSGLLSLSQPNLVSPSQSS